MADIEISFPQSDLAAAGQHARELRAALIRSGVPADGLKLDRAAGNTMDTASQLLLDMFKLGTEWASTGVNIATIAMAVYEMGVKDKLKGIRIKVGEAQVDLNPAEYSLQELRVVVGESLRAATKR